MALREIIARFGFQFDQRGLRQAQTGITGVVSQFRTFGAVIAGSAIVRGVANFVNDIVKTGDELGKTSKQLGLTTTELQQWRTAAQLSGASTEELTTGFRTLSKNALLAEQGSKQAADAYKILGVEVTDANGNLKDSSSLFRETGLALGQLENNTERTAIAQQLLGRSGVKLIPLFEQGGEALDEMLGKLEEYGGGIGPEAVRLSEEAADNFLFFELASDSLRSQLAVSLLPIITQVAGGLAKFIAWVSKATAGTSTFKSLLASLGLVISSLAITKFGGQFLSLARAAALPLLKFALLFLVVDDLIALFEGRGSVIGTVIDKLFGAGSAAKFVGEVKKIGSALGDLIFNFGETNKSADGFITDNETRFTKLASTIASSTDQIVNDFAEAWEFAKQDLSEFADSVLETISNIPSQIVAKAKEWAKAAGDLAKAFVDGIVEGIKSGAQAVIDALGSVVDGAVTAAKKKLGIKSPSRVAASEIGEPTAEGVAMGAMKAAKNVARQTATALSAAAALDSPSSISAPSRAGSGPTRGGVGGVVFKSDINIVVQGGSASDPQIQKLRQGVRSELRDNRRATLDALNQVIEAPA